MKSALWAATGTLSFACAVVALLVGDGVLLGLAFFLIGMAHFGIAEDQ